MLEKMKEIVRANGLCVLATVFEGIPHCSLMSYLADEEIGEIYLISSKQTRKYANLMTQPEVSLLIDTRSEGKSPILALTLRGRYHEIVDQEKKNALRARFLRRHPGVADLIQEEETDIFAIKISSWQLLEGVKDGHFGTVP